MSVMLDKKGLLLAFVMGVIIFLGGGIQFLSLMLFFLFISVAVTRYENKRKKDMGIYEHERSWENVLSNGIVPTILALANSFIGPLPFVGALAAVTADKFGSELGVLSPEPLSLHNLKPVKAGTSGAVSILGLIMSLLGATIIGVSSIFIFGTTPNQALLLGIIGLLGSVVDSLLGVFEERGIGTKGTTNLACSIVGAVLAWFLR